MDSYGGGLQKSCVSENSWQQVPLKNNATQPQPHSFNFISTTTTLPILPLPRSNYYHSNRLDLLYPTTPLPPSHCHPLERTGHENTRGPQHIIIISFFSLFFSLFSNCHISANTATVTF
jgi:hypothetical protein